MGSGKPISFFTKIAKTLLNYNSSDYLNEHERYALWENVSFYNYIQAIVGEGARIRPSGEMWKKSELAFQEVIQRLEPQVIIVLGKELADNLPAIPEGIEVCFLNHPSSGGYSYALNNQLVQNSIEKVKNKDDLQLSELIQDNRLNKSFTVAKVQRNLQWGNWRAKKVCSRAVSKELLSFSEKDGEIVYTVR
ncbi:hypothetical protein AB4407_09760 [Vibrio sp. 10N.261.46.E11]|uniref:hypothetical protein n=1 Tax=Vibrio sp. 10N.261.46.E11 TaxID=3229662 RepID=UPI0035530B75